MFTLSCSGGWVPGTFAEKIRGAAALGYKAIEPLFWIGEDLEAARAAIDETGCRISAICVLSATEDVSWARGIVYEEAREGFVRAVEETIQAAQTLGCETIVATTGNEIPGVSREAQHANVVAALRAALPALEASGITLVLEPLNILSDHPGYYLTTSKEGAEIVREVDSPLVRMLYDVYHQQITEGHLIPNIRRYISEIGHIHVADVPGRNEPGTGEINYKNVYKAIAEAGYEGYVALECGHVEPSLEVVTGQMFELVG